MEDYNLTRRATFQTRSCHYLVKYHPDNGEITLNFDTADNQIFAISKIEMLFLSGINGPPIPEGMNTLVYPPGDQNIAKAILKYAGISPEGCVIHNSSAMRSWVNSRFPPAIRWGQIHALGGNARNADGIHETFLARGHFNNDDFWQSVFRFFINNPMLDAGQYGNIIDFLRNQKFVIPAGAQQPPQPNLQMKDRNPETLLSQVESWHNELNRASRKRSKRPSSWDHHELVNDFIRKEGKKDNPIEYRVQQLLTSDELSTEGRRLSHCVSSYAWSCANGNTSIWSVRRMQPGDCWECLGTIELNNSSGMIVQFKAKHNSRPGIKAYNIMEYWRRENGLKISSWI